MAKIAFPLVLDRRFELWSYQVAHGVLLLRSNIGPGVETRIDLMFRGVTVLKLRDGYRDLAVDLIPMDRVEEELGDDHVALEDGMFAFSIATGGKKCGYVVAGSLYLAEDDMDYGEPSAIDHPEFEDRILRAEECR